MYYMNKKGLAGVVAMVALILITTASAVIVANFMTSFLGDSEIYYSSATSCLELQSGGTIDITGGCYNSLTGDIEIEIERRVDNVEVYTLDITLNGDSVSETYSCGYSCGNCVMPTLGEKKTYYFEQSGVKQVIVHTDNCVLDKLDITREC